MGGAKMCRRGRIGQFLLQDAVVDRISIEGDAHDEYYGGDEAQDEGQSQPLLGNEALDSDYDDGQGPQKHDNTS